MANMKQERITTHPALFSAMVTLFFIWGFITLLNDLLIPVLKERLELDYTQSMFIQFCFFITYFIMAFPMSSILNRIGYKKSILFGLLIIAIGGIIFIPATLILDYNIFLIALFILAMGVVMLQVSANPLMVALGDKKTSSARLTLAQGFNSLGYVVAPLLVGGIIVSSKLFIPYLIISAVMILTIIFISIFKFNLPSRQLREDEEMSDNVYLILWQDKMFLLGLLAIFVYVGAEVTAGSLIVNYLHLPRIVGFSLATAAEYLSIYWGGVMIGRLIGSFLLIRINPAKALMFNSVVNILLLILVILSYGYLAMWALLLLGVFNSIMFPTIFALTIKRLKTIQLKNCASGLPVMAIVGGAFIPLFQGELADRVGLQHSFVGLIVCYLVIVIYGYLHRKINY